jgi:hypothetical protein
MVLNGIPRFLFYFVPRNGIMSCFLFCGMEFRELASIFVPWKRNSKLFSLPRKGLERNSESFLFLGTTDILESWASSRAGSPVS